MGYTYDGWSTEERKIKLRRSLLERQQEIGKLLMRGGRREVTKGWGEPKAVEKVTWARRATH